MWGYAKSGKVGRWRRGKKVESISCETVKMGERDNAELLRCGSVITRGRDNKWEWERGREKRRVDKRRNGIVFSGWE